MHDKLLPLLQTLSKALSVTQPNNPEVFLIFWLANRLGLPAEVVHKLRVALEPDESEDITLRDLAPQPPRDGRDPSKPMHRPWPKAPTPDHLSLSRNCSKGGGNRSPSGTTSPTGCGLQSASTSPTNGAGKKGSKQKPGQDQ